MEGSPLQNAKSGLKTGGASAGQSKTDHFHPRTRGTGIRCGGVGVEDLLEIIWQSNLANTPLLKTGIITTRN